MVISATSDPQYHSSRRLLGAYAEAAVAGGWILVAADPAEEVAVERDDVSLRYALNAAALAALESQWPEAGKAPLAFGGFLAAKFSGWLAAAFAHQGRSIIGIYLAGINADTVIAAARHFSVLNESFRRTPVFLQSGQNDTVATPGDHRSIHGQLERAGFREVVSSIGQVRTRSTRDRCGRRSTGFARSPRQDRTERATSSAPLRWRGDRSVG